MEFSWQPNTTNLERNEGKRGMAARSLVFSLLNGKQVLGF